VPDIIESVTSTQLRLEPSSFPVLIEHAARYSDLDPSRRIGRDALVRWFEDARVSVELDALGADLSTRYRSRQFKLLLASVGVEVIAPLKVAGRYRIGVGVAHIGTSSFTYTYAVFAGDECVATGRSVSVYVTDEGPTELPADVRAALTALKVEGAEQERAERLPGRLVREAYPFRLDIRTRFGDIDTNRHVNNVALAGWYFDALAELHLDMLGYPTGGPLDDLSPSSLHVEYLAEVHYPGIYQLRVGVLELDASSVRYACGLFDGPRCIGLAEAVGSHADADGTTGDVAASLGAWRMRKV
jgi:acyl-CoA thioester hydrolase